MVQWQPCPPIPVEDFFSSSLRKGAKALNERIDKLVADRAAFDRNEASFRARDTADKAGQIGGEIFIAEQLRIEHLNLLGQEIAIRRELAEFDNLRHKEREAAYDKANQDHLQVTAEIRQKLLDLGYHPESPCTPDPNALQPGMIMRHPAVRAAYNRQETLRGQVGDRGFLSANQQVLKALETKLQTIRLGGLQPAGAA